MLRLFSLSIVYATLLLSFSTSAGPTSSPALMRFKDFGNLTAYQLLEVPEFSDHATCKKAFRRLAQKYHPGANHGDKASEIRIMGVNVAWNYIDGLEKSRHLEEVAKKEAQKRAAEKAAAKAPLEVDADLEEELFGGPVDENSAAQDFASQQSWTPPPNESYAQPEIFRKRDEELMALLDSLVSRRMHKMIDADKVDKVMDFLKQRYRVNLDHIFKMITNNLFHDLPSELLVRAATKYFLTEHQPHASGMVPVLRQHLELEKSFRIESIMNSEQIRSEFDLLLQLSYAVTEMEWRFGPQAKPKARKKPFCERVLWR